ncbi:hypothetical protein Val02_58460 [Virgisporangium aliadipatigenens]|uniref:Uncharacterized protein n=1 Tax=Virgisporangium aliadipatigenens TaxID=741659 RepID=A0A8J3YS57_9ACTN|nr:LPXTG cell wall anchor domain-containing protein [Virgisporangium aliadipatigenens]GIJ48960.1 hypothetical protein Val02_58460 [Virgisporangium aliadipatigenens]
MARSLVVVALAAAFVVLPATARADTTGTGGAGQRLTVSKTAGLAAGGETVTVEGSGYDVEKGIYVAFCVDNGAGQVPGPCGGGADTSGSTGASHWISSHPPAYGEGLAQPYGPGGTFRVTLRLTAALNADTDCRTAKCAVVTRADHTRTSDRSQDVRVPVGFGTGGGAAVPPAATTRPGAAPAGSTRAVPDAGAAPASSVPAPGAALPAPSIGDARPPDLSVTRVSVSESASRWWTGIGIAILLLLTAAVLSRRRRRS